MKRLCAAFFTALGLCFFVAFIAGCGGKVLFVQSSDSAADSEMFAFASDGAVSAEKFIVRFEVNGGGAVADIEIPEGYVLDLSGIVTEKDGARFCGWYSDEALSERVDGYFCPDKDVTLYAKWAEIFSVRFDCKGGGEISALVGEAGELISAPDPPEKEGYVFEGWYREEEYTTVYEFISMPPENITLYAKWRELQKNIEIILHINSPVSEEDMQIPILADEGDEAELDLIAEAFQAMTARALDGFLLESSGSESEPVYTIVGWAYDESGKDVFGGTIPQAFSVIDLYAVWERSPEYCKITFSDGNALGGSVSYYAVKGTAVPDRVTEEITERLNAYYRPIGLVAEGFFTSDGVRYAGQPVAEDVELYPFLTEIV